MMADKFGNQEVFFKDTNEKMLFRSTPDEEGFYAKEIGSPNEIKMFARDSKILTDAILEGDEITKEEYYA